MAVRNQIEFVESRFKIRIGRINREDLAGGGGGHPALNRKATAWRSTFGAVLCREALGGTTEVSLPMDSYQRWCDRAQSHPVAVLVPPGLGHNPACWTSWGRRRWPRSRSACRELLAWQSLIRFDGIRWKQGGGETGPGGHAVPGAAGLEPQSFRLI